MIKITSIFLQICLLITMMFVTSSYAANTKPTTDYQAVVKQINQIGDDLIAKYTPENALDAIDGFSKLYFDHYEGSGMELAVAAISPTINVKTETLFTQIIGAASSGSDSQTLQRNWAKLKLQLNVDLDLLKNNTANTFLSAFLQAFSILLREGFEALL